MVLEHKSIELEQKVFAEYIKVKGPYSWKTSLQNRACFIYWMNGENRLFCQTGEIHSSGKESLLLSCGNYIDDVFSREGEEIEAVVIHFYPDMLRRLFGDNIPQTILKQSPSPVPYPVKLQQDAIFTRYVDGLLYYIRHPQLADQDLLTHKLKELFLLLQRSALRATLKELFLGLFCPEEITFKEVIAANLYSGLDLKDLAYLTNRSLASFKRDFNKYYGTSPSAFIREARLQKAATLLRGTGMRMGDISCECGFKNASHFSRVFHQRFRLSPSDFRMSHSEK